MGSEQTTSAAATRIGELRRVDALRARYYDSADSVGEAHVGASAPIMALTGKWHRQKGNYYSTEPTELATELH